MAKSVSSSPRRLARSLSAPAYEPALSVSQGVFHISFPSPDRVQMFSADLFSDPQGVISRRFLERAFLAPEVQSVEIEGNRRRAEISFEATATGGRDFIRKISGFFKRDDVPVNGSSPLVFPPILPESETNVVRVYRHGHVLSTWKVKHETPGRIRFQNPALHRKRELCQAIERELMSVPGSTATHQRTDGERPGLLQSAADSKHQIVEILDDDHRQIGKWGKDPDRS